MTRLRKQLDKEGERFRVPVWIRLDIWDKLVRAWNSEEFQQKRNTNKKNRASAKGGTVHTGGSISYTEHRRRMEKQLNRPVSLREVFKRTHTKKDSEEFICPRSKETYENFERMYEASTRASAANPDEEETGETTAEREVDIEAEAVIWSQVVGGPYKGRVYGTGSDAHVLAIARVGGGVATQPSQSEGRFAPEFEALLEERLGGLRDDFQRYTDRIESLEQAHQETSQRVAAHDNMFTTLLETMNRGFESSSAMMNRGFEETRAMMSRQDERMARHDEMMARQDTLILQQAQMLKEMREQRGRPSEGSS